MGYPMCPNAISPRLRAAFLVSLGFFLFSSVANLGSEARVAPELLRRAEADGMVRVIVEIRVGSEGIAAAQEAVLQALAGSPHRVTHRYTAIPFLALEASPEALRRLATLAAVLQVREDRLLAPQGKTP